MEPYCYGMLDAIRYWPLPSSDLSHKPLFEGGLDDDVLDDGRLVDLASDSHVQRGPWTSLAGGRLRLCQLGPLTPAHIDPVARRRGSSFGIYRRRLLLRRIIKNDPTRAGRDDLFTTPSKPKAREIIVFHFTGGWNDACQVDLAFAHVD